MDKLEKVELIREKTGVSYEEAKKALEASDWDTLDAVLYIEALGKINHDNYSFKEELKKTGKKIKEKCNPHSSAADKFFSWCGRVVRRSMEIKFKIMNNDEEKISLPLLVVVVLMIFAFWITVPLLIIGSVCGLRYRFEGIDTVTVDLNDLSEKASSAIDDLKKSYEG